MKVLQVNCVYKKGSTGKITYDLHKSLLDSGIKSIVCYGRGKRYKEINVYKICYEWYSKLNNILSRFSGFLYGGCFFSTNKLFRIIDKEKPDIVHLQCINGYFVNIYRLISWLKKKKIKTIITLHGEFIHTGNCGHSIECQKWKIGCGNCPHLKREIKSIFFDKTAHSWKKMKNSFAGFDCVKIFGCSQWITERANQSPILSGLNVQCIYNGIDISNFYPNSNDHNEIKKKYGIPLDKKIVLHVTALFNEVKGTDLLFDISKLFPSNYYLVIVGHSGENKDNISFIPFTTNQKELADLYRVSDVFAITSRVDNYPTVCLEANCCGTPVVGFDVGGVSETIFKGMGCVVEPFDVKLFLYKLIEWAEKKKDISIDTIEKCRKHNSFERMKNDYLSVYNK